VDVPSEGEDDRPSLGLLCSGSRSEERCEREEDECEGGEKTVHDGADRGQGRLTIEVVQERAALVRLASHDRTTLE
jgi:hypothetical protein